jgi:hypothetical protein
LSSVLENIKRNISETGPVSILRWGGRHLFSCVPEKELTSITGGAATQYENRKSSLMTAVKKMILVWSLSEPSLHHHLVKVHVIGLVEQLNPSKKSKPAKPLHDAKTTL